MSIGRSDAEHFRVGLSLSGLLAILICAPVIPRSFLVWVFLLVCGLPGPQNSLFAFVKETLRKKEVPEFSEPLTKVESPFSGDLAVFTPSSKEFTETTKLFLARHPSWEREGLFMTENGYLPKIFLGIRDVTRWPMHHYLLSMDEQKKVVLQLENESIPMVFFDQRPSVMRYTSPRYLGWPLLTQSLHKHYFPCASLGAWTTVMVPKSKLGECRREALSEKQLERNFYTSSELAYLPALLAQSKEVLEKAGLHLFFLRLREAVRGEETLAFQWKCRDLEGVERENKIYFVITPATKNYALPLDANAGWSYCRSKLEVVVVRPGNFIRSERRYENLE